MRQHLKALIAIHQLEGLNNRMSSKKITKPEHQPLAVIYSRVSGEKQLKGTSLDSQTEECIKYAESLGYKVSRVAIEQHSGEDLEEREVLSDVRAEIDGGLYDALVVYALDRLSRDQEQRSVINYFVRKAGARIFSVTEQIDESITGKLMQNVYSFVAEIELDKIRERNIRGKKTNLRQGKFVRASDLYGYSFDIKNRKRVIKENEAAIVRRIYNEFLTGTGIRGIYKKLNVEGVPSPAEGKREFKKIDHFTNLKLHGRTLWNKGAIYRILTEIAYTGKTFGWKHKSVKKYVNGKRRRLIYKRPEEEWIALPDSVTPLIITAEAYQAVQEKLKDNKGEQTRNETRPELLRGLVFCADCGRKMYPQVEQRKTRIYKRKIYRCSSRDTIICEGKSINAEKCEQKVWAKIVEIIQNPRIIVNELEKKNSDRIADRKKIEDEISSIEENLVCIENKISMMVKRSATVNEETWKTFEKEINIFQDEKKRHFERIINAKSRLRTFDADVNSIKSLSEFSDRVAINLENFDFADKRQTLESLGVKIIGSGKEVRVDWFLPVMNDEQEFRHNHSAYRSAGFWQNDAGETAADDFAAA